MILNWVGGMPAENFQMNANLYYMDYQNQLVLTGGIDDVGAFVRQNSGNSYRLGLEVDATVIFSEKLSGESKYCY